MVNLDKILKVSDLINARKDNEARTVIYYESSEEGWISFLSSMIIASHKIRKSNYQYRSLTFWLGESSVKENE